MYLCCTFKKLNAKSWELLEKYSEHWRFVYWLSIEFLVDFILSAGYKQLKSGSALLYVFLLCSDATDVMRCSSSDGIYISESCYCLSENSSFGLEKKAYECWPFLPSSLFLKVEPVPRRKPNLFGRSNEEDYGRPMKTGVVTKKLFFTFYNGCSLEIYRFCFFIYFLAKALALVGLAHPLLKLVAGLRKLW